MMKRIVTVVGSLLVMAGALSVSPIAGSERPPGATAHDVAGASAADGNVVPLDVAYGFDAQDLVSIPGTSALPIPRGSVSAHWYAFQGWAVVVFEGLDLATSGPLCLGTSTIDPATGLITQVAFDPTAAGACDDAGAGAVPLAAADVGVRTCSGPVAFLTRIPVEAHGPLVANALTFPGDGTGIGVSGRLDVPEPLREIDRSIVDCGPLPPARQPQPVTPTPEPTPVATPAPDSTGSIPAADRIAAPAPAEATECAEAADGLQDVFTTPAGPYLVKHPETPGDAVATIVFLPGGNGSYGSAQRVWETFFSSGVGFEAFRVVIPYTVDEDLIGQAARTYAIVDEILSCHGGDPMKVHLAGTSNGGLAAFGLMVRQPERFATLLGAPGAFPVQDPASVDPQVWVDRLAGRAIFNGVGEFDVDWRPEVIATHNALAAAGIESRFVEFPRQGHIPSSGFDSRTLLEFWEAHG